MSCLVTAFVFLASNAAIGHHSIIPFDQTTFAELEGVVSAVSWRNPHFRFTVLVDTEAGEEEWALEGGSVNPPARRGFNGDALRVGDRVRVAGRPSIRDRRELFVTHILLPSGEEIVTAAEDLAPRWTGGPDQSPRDSMTADSERSIFRVWSLGELYQPRSPFVLTAEAEAARVGWDPFIDTPAIRCIAPGMPNAILNPYPIELIDEGDHIRLRIEEWEATRMIDMVSAEIPNDAPTSRLGYSIGRWEGETLVVDTARVDSPYLDDTGTPMSEDVRMVERFTVSQDGSRLDYEISVTDSRNLVEPAIWDVAWRTVPGTEIMSFECDLE